jgi:hypothetical protein
MERCAAGAFEVTVEVRFAPRKYQALPAIAISAMIPAPNNAKIERRLGTAGLVSFACALPTSSE